MHISFDMLNLWRLSIQEKGIQKTLGGDSNTHHLNQERIWEKMKTVNGVDRAVHSLPQRKEMHADSEATACWDGFLHSVWDDW